MELTIFERLNLLNILPPAGDLTTIRIVRKLREALSFTEAEAKEHNVAVDAKTNQVTWDNDREKPIEFGAKAREIAVKALEALDEAGTVEEKHLTLFDKFGVGLD